MQERSSSASVSTKLERPANLAKQMAVAARSHIERKYEYAKRWIRTAEQFIEHTATKSSISGEPYSVTCSGREELSSDWLKRELERFRTAGN